MHWPFGHMLGHRLSLYVSQDFNGVLAPYVIMVDLPAAVALLPYNA